MSAGIGSEYCTFRNRTMLFAVTCATKIETAAATATMCLQLFHISHHRRPRPYVSDIALQLKWCWSVDVFLPAVAWARLSEWNRLCTVYGSSVLFLHNFLCVNFRLTCSWTPFEFSAHSFARTHAIPFSMPVVIVEEMQKTEKFANRLKIF